MPGLRVELVVVGDELQSGSVLDSNSALLGRELTARGWIPSRRVVVGDVREDISEATRQAAGAEVVFVVGGLGPTSDDVTLDAVSEATGLPIVEDATTLRSITRRFLRRGQAMPRLARRQARVLASSQILPNPVGAVPGMAVRWRGGWLVLLPGVPEEFEGLLVSGVLPILERELKIRPQHVTRIRTCGVAEARIAARASSLSRRYPAVRFGFYPGQAGVDVVLTSVGPRQLAGCRRRLLALLGPMVYEVGNRDLAEVVLATCRERGLTLATAESCTGGLVGDLITRVPGSSDCYVGGVIAYANPVKERVLAVGGRTLAAHGAVSGPVVRQMARGVCRLLGADAGIAVSGVAGPGGGTSSKPVGLVWTAVAIGKRVSVRRHWFPGSRQAVKRRAAAAALDQCRRLLARTAGDRP